MTADAPRRDETPAAVDDVQPTQRERRVRRLARRVPIVSGVSAVVVAALLGLVITLRGGVLEFDNDWAAELDETRGPIGDVISLFMNALGGGVVGVLVVPIGIAVMLVLWRRPWAALYFVVASAVSAGVVQLLKQTFGRARPEEMMVPSDFGSFPSGHVANAATIAVALGIIVPRVWVWVLGAVYTVLMAATRTYLGVHWLSDTIGGTLVGVGAALVVWAAFAVVLERERLARLARISLRNETFAQSHVTPPIRPRA